MIRVPRLIRILLAAVACLVLAGVAVAQNQEQPSLGDLARRNKEKKAQQDAAKSKKVYGSEDLPKAPPGSESAASAAAAGSGGPSTAGATGETQAASTEAAPAGEGGEQAASPEAKDAQARLERAEEDEAAVQKNIEKLQKQLETETSEFRRNLYQESLDRSKENLAAYRAKREEAEKAAAAAGSGKKPEGQPPPQ
jgi:hypothetical protein